MWKLIISLFDVITEFRSAEVEALHESREAVIAHVRPQEEIREYDRKWQPATLTQVSLEEDVDLPRH